MSAVKRKADDGGSGDHKQSSHVTPNSKIRIVMCQLMVGTDKSANLKGAADAVSKAVNEHNAQIVVLPVRQCRCSVSAVMSQR